MADQIPLRPAVVTTRSRRPHRIAFVAQEAYPFESPTEYYAPFSYAVRKLQASIKADPGLSECETAVIDIHSSNPDEFFDAICQFRPTLVALSAYIWSISTFLRLARQIKAHDPTVAVVLGGPAARVSLLALEPYRGLLQYVDAVVSVEGEEVIRALARRDVRDWRDVPGLLLPHSLGLRATAEPERIVLDEYPSPYQLGIVPSDYVGYMETFRGCPMSCAFCQWGDARSDRVHSVEFMASHLQGLSAARATEVMFLDAAFNLSPRAHKNLMEAERQVGVLRNLAVYGHLYPTHVDDSFLDFVDRTKKVRVMFGIQSFDREVLRAMSRPFNLDRFLSVAQDLRGRIPIEIEIIMGLPGDNPRSFRRTIEKAVEIADTVRIFYPLVLPDALLERAEQFAIEFDPLSFRLLRCKGWDTTTLSAQWDDTVSFAQSMPRHVVNDTMAAFTTARGMALSSHRSLAHEELEPLRAALAHGGVALARADHSDSGGLIVVVDHGALRMEIEIDLVSSGRPSLISRDGVDYSHRGDLEPQHTATLRSVIDSIHDTARMLLVPQVPRPRGPA